MKETPEASHPFTGLEEEVIYKFLLSTEKLDSNQVQIKETSGEFVPNQVLVKEDHHNVFSYSRSTIFSPIVQKVSHNWFPPFEEGSGQEPSFKNFKVFWILCMDSHEIQRRMLSQRIAGIFIRPLIPLSSNNSPN